MSQCFLLRIFKILASNFCWKFRSPSLNFPRKILKNILVFLKDFSEFVLQLVFSWKILQRFVVQSSDIFQKLNEEFYQKTLEKLHHNFCNDFYMTFSFYNSCLNSVVCCFEVYLYILKSELISGISWKISPDIVSTISFKDSLMNNSWFFLLGEFLQGPL